MIIDFYSPFDFLFLNSLNIIGTFHIVESILKI